jgi:hypothetical protein
MDCVTGCGDAAILYCADLRWRGIHAAYSSVLSADEGRAESHSSMARYRLSSRGGEIHVAFPRLKVSGRWHADAAPMQHTVYGNASGSVLWNCLQPRSTVHLRVGEREFTGLGYAECLTLTLPPWQLPMRKLRWGRFVSPDHSLAWVDWQGSYSTSFAIHNGVQCEIQSVSDSEVAVCGATLRMDESLSLRAGRVEQTILPEAPTLGKLLPHSLFNIEERKWRSRGILNAQDRSSSGWAIHEVVDWKI